MFKVGDIVRFKGYRDPWMVYEVRSDTDYWISGPYDSKVKAYRHMLDYWGKLKERDMIIKEYIYLGKSNTEIAKMLGLTLKTVQHIARKVMKHYNVKTRPRLILAIDQYKKETK